MKKYSSSSPLLYQVFKNLGVIGRTNDRWGRPFWWNITSHVGFPKEAANRKQVISLDNILSWRLPRLCQWKSSQHIRTKQPDYVVFCQLCSEASREHLPGLSSGTWKLRHKLLQFQFQGQMEGNHTQLKHTYLWKCPYFVIGSNASIENHKRTEVLFYSFRQFQINFQCSM